VPFIALECGRHLGRQLCFQAIRACACEVAHRTKRPGTSAKRTLHGVARPWAGNHGIRSRDECIGTCEDSEGKFRG
jgi:hypothetical protein